MVVRDNSLYPYNGSEEDIAIFKIISLQHFPTKCTFGVRQLFKLDRVGPVDNRPSTDKLK